MTAKAAYHDPDHVVAGALIDGVDVHELGIPAAGRQGLVVHWLQLSGAGHQRSVQKIKE